MKRVVAFLPGDVVQDVHIDHDLKSVELFGDNGSRFSLPIEKFLIDGREFLIARSSDLISDEQIRLALVSGKYL